MELSAANPANGSHGRTDPRAGKYLTFDLDREEYAIQVLRVREIMVLQEITGVPHTPKHVKGVINLRGKVIPVVDLRLKLGLAQAEYGDRTCIIVVQIHGEPVPMLTGIIVDSVAEVVNISAGDIEDTPDFGEGVTIPYVLGVAKSKNKVRILVDIDRALGTDHVQPPQLQ